MIRRSFQRIFSFVIVLVLTVAAVAVFSAMSRQSPQKEEAVPRFSVGTGQHEAMKAPATGEPGISPIASIAGFAGLLMLPVAGAAIFAIAKRPGKKAKYRAGTPVRKR